VALSSAKIDGRIADQGIECKPLLLKGINQSASRLFEIPRGRLQMGDGACAMPSPWPPPAALAVLRRHPPHAKRSISQGLVAVENKLPNKRGAAEYSSTVVLGREAGVTGSVRHSGAVHLQKSLPLPNDRKWSFTEGHGP